VKSIIVANRLLNAGLTLIIHLIEMPKDFR
jgi:hypothetical protein